MKTQINVWFRFAVLLIFFSFLSGCHLIQKGSLSLNFENEIRHYPLSIQIQYLEGVTSSEKVVKEQKVELAESNQISIPVDFSGVDRVKIVIQDQNLDQLLMPFYAVKNTPHWWQTQNLYFSVKLHYIQTPPLKKKSIAHKNSVLAEKNTDKVPGPRVTSQEIAEETIEDIPKELLEESATEMKIQRKKDASSNHISNEHSVPKKEKKDEFRSVTFSTTSDQKPLENVQVYFVNRYSQTYERACETLGEKGSCAGGYFASFPPSYLLFYKAGYESVIQDFHFQSNLQINLIKNKNSNLFGVFQRFYDHPRAAPGFLLASKGVKKYVSHQSGFFVVKKNLKELPDLTLENQKAIETKISGPVIKKHIKNATLKGKEFYVALKENVKPGIAFLETYDDRFEKDETFRRVRRVFTTSLMNELSFRTIISQQTQRILESINPNIEDILSRGWSGTPLDNIFDFLLQGKYEIVGGERFLNLILLDRFGNHIFDEKVNIDEEKSQEKSVALFQKFVGQFPLEGNVIEAKTKEGKLNLGSRNHVCVGDRFLLSTATKDFSSPVVPTAVAQIDRVEDTTSHFQVTAGGEKLLNKKVIHVVKASQDAVENFLARSGKK